MVMSCVEESILLSYYVGSCLGCRMYCCSRIRIRSSTLWARLGNRHRPISIDKPLSILINHITSSGMNSIIIIIIIIIILNRLM